MNIKNIGGKNIFIHDDAYTIDHDFNRYKLDKPFLLREKDNKLLFKKNIITFIIYYNMMVFC